MRRGVASGVFAGLWWFALSVIAATAAIWVAYMVLFRTSETFGW